MPHAIEALAALGAAVMGGAWLMFCPPFAVIRMVQRVWPDIVFFVPGDVPRVALTLDDGPDRDASPRVIEVLRQTGVRATWFVMGERVERHPEVYRELVAEGHEIGNHMWSEIPALRLDREAFRAAVARTERAIGSDNGCRLLRPASGWLPPWGVVESRSLGYRIVLGSASCSDWLKPPDAFMRWALVRMARPGAIIVLHVGPGRLHTARILPDVVAGVRAKGLEFVTVGELIGSAPRRLPESSG